MLIELLAGTTNVVRFPAERRAHPSLELLRDIVPDVREALSLAEGFGLPAPVTALRDAADRATAEYIRDHVHAEAGSQRQADLEGLLTSVTTMAVESCWRARDAAAAAAEAHQRVAEAGAAGGYWLTPLRERADGLAHGAACLLIETHAHAEEAEGVARAVGMALRNEAWVPFDLDAEAEALFFGNRARA